MATTPKASVTTFPPTARQAPVANGSKNVAQKVKLVRHKGVIGGKIISAGKKLFIYAIIKDNEIFYNRFFFIVKQRKALTAYFILFQNTLANNFIYVGRGKSQPCVETTLNFREIVAFYFGYRVYVLLACNYNPDFAFANTPQIFGNGLQIKH